MENVARHASGFDVMHFHFDHWYFSPLECHATPILTTLHGRLDLLPPTYDAFRDLVFPRTHAGRCAVYQVAAGLNKRPLQQPGVRHPKR